MQLRSIPAQHFNDYRYEVIFGAYKWDPQVGDQDTIARHTLLLSRDAAAELETLAEALAAETCAMEQALLHKPHLAKRLGLPKKIERKLPLLAGYEPERHVRLMRFDFHPTPTGWVISEVNSDVPGGLAEASVLPQFAQPYFSGYEPGKSIADALFSSFKEKAGERGRIAFVHATSYSDDQQVMRFLSDHFSAQGFQTQLAAPDHLHWSGKKAVSILEGEEGELDGIVRFFPLEWLTNLPRNFDWAGYYQTETVSCNHPIAIYAQSKRLPLVWDELGVDIPTWKALLPETRDPRSKGLTSDFIFKPALGRVGEGISIKEAVSPKEFAAINKAAKRNPLGWLAQRRFESAPLIAEGGTAYHLCIGVFTVDGKAAGFYGRISPYPRIDANAKDIPLLVAKEEQTHE
jgi:Glutathionylspermidine synthase